MKKYFKKNWFIILIVALCIIKQVMVTCIPIFAISNGRHDDLMMVIMGDALLRFKWLGHYTQYTLVKGCFFPFFLAITNFIGIRYIDAANLFYTFSSLFFCFSIKDIFKEKHRKLYILILFTILLFNPVSYAFWTLQRIYRNGMTLSQVLLILGGLFNTYIKLYNHKDIKKCIPYLLVAGFGLASFANTREDAIWIFPFVFIVSFVLLGIALTKYKSTIKINIRNIFIIIIPIIMLVIVNLGISTLNYIAYGIFTTNELNNSYFKNAMKSIYSIKNNEDIEYVSVTREKVNRLYEMSPSLNSIKDKLESSLDNFSSMDRNPDDSEVEDGWFFWALRSAVDAAGYYTDAKTANQFYKKVSDEINDYVKKNNIETVTTMPSALMSPWRKGYTIKLVNTSIKILKYIISFQDVETTNSVSTSDNANGINKFEAISNNFAYTENSYYSLRGWIFAKDNTELELEVRDYNNNLIDKISFIDSLDVYEAYNEEYKSAKKCRFEVKNYIGNVNLKLVIINKKTKEETVIDLDQPNYEIGNDNYEYNIDSYTKNMYDSITQKSTQKYVDRLNGITKVYQKLNPIVFVVSIICYIIITIKMILNIINKKYQYVPVWLIVTSIILSMLVLIIGVAYNEISSCASINYMYLSGSYPLMLTFEIITIIYTISNCIKKRY